ncbi:MAG TPA: hypothetical protein VFR84_15705 [Candidatus Angelobacter sp.]|nr:hypothetical protein [Candidatus Angelobacter sp.]
MSQTARKIPAIAISNLLRLQSTSRRTRISLTAIRRLLFRNSELTLSSPPAANQLLLPRTLRRVCASLAIAINRLLLRLTLPRLGHPFPISPATAEAGQ